MKTLRKTTVLLVATWLALGLVWADVKLPAIISDHMVLQQTAKVPLWGRADPDEEVTVTLDKQITKTKAANDGKWSVTLNLLKSASGPHEVVIEGRNRLVIKDVVVGEVWLASGQSNMELPLSETLGAGKEIPVSANPMLREFRVGLKTSEELLDDCTGKWVAASPSTSQAFSAVGYYFGQKLNAELNVPVGLINASWGGTPSEAWTSSRAIDTVPDLKAARETQMQLSHEARSKENGLLEGEVKSVTNAAASARPQDRAGLIFNGMINPLIPYAIRGVIWNQGESNVLRAWQYRVAFPLLINDWRAQWRQGDFPFYFCQLANYRPKFATPGESSWAEVREAQTSALKLPHTGQAVLIDIGEGLDMHPRNKKDAGERLARIALAMDYGNKIPFSGPVYESAKVQQGKIRIKFTHTDGGLVAKPLPDTYVVRSFAGETAPLVRNSPNSELEGFALYGEDGKWFWADAKIEGDSVLVWADQVPKPIAVRFCWADNPNCNLYNASGLPASPFRTDDFPATTLNNKY